MQGDLEATIAMTQHLEVYRGGDGAKTSGKGPKKFTNQKKGNMAQVEGSSSGDRPGDPSREKTAAKEGQGWHGLRWEEDKEERTKESAVPQLW